MQLQTVKHLVALLNDEDEDVLTNVVGALSECCVYNENREAVRTGGGLKPMVDLLNWTHAPLLENLSRCLAECAKEAESMAILEQLDAVRLIWSLLKNPNPRVQAYAAFALCPCVNNAAESGELVRSLVGAMELVVDLLHSKDTLVLAAVCAAIAEIAKDIVNLAILSDHKVINMLADLGKYCGHYHNKYSHLAYKFSSSHKRRLASRKSSSGHCQLCSLRHKHPAAG